MKYELDTWRSGTEERPLPVAAAARLLADDQTILVGAVAAEDVAWLKRGEASPALTMVLWENPLSGEPGEPLFVMRWASGSPVTPGSDETLAMHRVIARARRIAALAGRLRDDETAEEPEEFDLVRSLATLAVAALRSPQGIAPAAAIALMRLKRELGITGATPADEAVETIRAALQGADHADR